MLPHCMSPSCMLIEQMYFRPFVPCMLAHLDKLNALDLLLPELEVAINAGGDEEIGARYLGARFAWKHGLKLRRGRSQCAW